MASVAFLLAEMKKDPTRFISCLPILQVCAKLGVVYRNRVLDPATTTALFIKQVIHGNRSCAATRHLGTKTFTAQAYCQARMRLPLAVLQALSSEINNVMRFERRSGGQWNARDLFLPFNTFVVDGTAISMSDTKVLQDEFGQSGMQKKGCGFPVAHLLGLFDVNTGMLMEVIASPMRTHDLSKVSLIHPQMREGDLLLGDTAFGSFAHFALLLEGKMHGLMPGHQLRIFDFTPHRPFVKPTEVDEDSKGIPRSRWIKSLGEEDQLVEWFKPPACPKYMSAEQYAALPESIILREVRREVYRPELNSYMELIIVTTLLDEKTYPVDLLVELRMRRWQVEVNIRHLKTTMGMEVLKCQTVDGVRKELAVFALVYNLVHVIMNEAARRQKTTPDRISFKDVLVWIGIARPGDKMPQFIVNKYRPGRIEPRVVKRRPTPHPFMTKPRRELREALKNKAKAA
jgi:hypothetical protein